MPTDFESIRVYALRVDEIDGAVRAGIMAFLAAMCTAFLLVRETVAGENPHYHGILHAAHDAKKLRNSFRTHLPMVVGNKSYSLKKCDDDYEPYHRYLCKGESSELLPDICARMGLDYTEENVKLWHEAFWVNRAEIDSQRQKRKKLTSATVAEKLYEICVNKGVRYSQREQIAREYLRLCKAANKPISIYYAKSVINIVVLKLDHENEGAENELVQYLLNA